MKTFLYLSIFTLLTGCANYRFISKTNSVSSLNQFSDNSRKIFCYYDQTQFLLASSKAEEKASLIFANIYFSSGTAPLSL
jgi:hypothetical protein